MIKEKLRDVFAIFAIIFALILSVVLFVVRSESGYTYNNEYFGREDIYENWNEAKTHRINLNDCVNSLTIEDGGYYELSGDLEGQVTISGSSKSVYFIRLAGVNINNENGPCILVNNAGKVILELLEGSKNAINMGANSLDESLDGAIYSKDDLTVRGGGTLAVTGNYSHGIVCNDKLVFVGGNIKIDAKEDGVHANDLVAMRETTMNITSGDDGITVKNDDGTGTFFGESGEVTINNCYEGIEADDIIIENGKYTLYPTDDGINAMTTVDIKGGEIRIENTGGDDVDGIDSNKDILISGGNIYISLPQGGMNMPIDYGEENVGKLDVTGGSVEAYVGGEAVDAVEVAKQGMFGGKIDEMFNRFGDKSSEEFGGEIPGKHGGQSHFDKDIEKPDVYSSATPNVELPQRKEAFGKDFSENFKEEVNRKTNSPPEMREPETFNQTETRNGNLEVIVIIGGSIITLCIAFIILLTKNSRVNI